MGKWLDKRTSYVTMWLINQTLARVCQTNHHMSRGLNNTGGGGKQGLTYCRWTDEWKRSVLDIDRGSYTSGRVKSKDVLRRDQ